MDSVARQIAAYRALGVQSSVALKLDTLMDLEQARDPRVIEFMLTILADPLEHNDVRIHVLKRVRNGMLTAELRPTVGSAIVHVLQSNANMEMRLQAALALGEFTGVDGVVAALWEIARAPDEILEIRYAAFTSMDRAGPTPEYLDLLRQLTADEVLGDSARRVLDAWCPRPTID